MIVSTTNFSLQRPTNPDDFWRRTRQMVQQAANRGADFILFPEYFSLSWLLAEGGEFRARLLDGGKQEERFVEELRRASSEFRIAIIGGTFPHLEPGEKIYNRSWIFLPGKTPAYQDKVNMTRFESEDWKISPGPAELRIFRHASAVCAVATCYDVEFPAYCAAAAEAKVDILFVPSCTDDIHGYWRVRHCAEARAIENQCFVLMSSIVEGDARYPNEVGAHFGRACVLSPCDSGFPEGGIMAEAQANVETMVDARLELRALHEIRKSGTVLNLSDGAATTRIKPVS